jgi:Domain of unknown function (DUF4139)/N-terminal domain of unknown function (DUF4140)
MSEKIISIKQCLFQFKILSNVKKSLFFSLIILCATQAIAQDFPQQKIESKIEKVTVFLNGAQVQRSAKMNLPNGKSELILRGLTPNLEQQSVIVKGEGNFTIVSVKPQLNFLEEIKKKDTIITLETERERLLEAISLDSMELLILKNEEEILQKNRVQVIGIQDNVNKSEELTNLLDIQRKRLSAIYSRKLELKKIADKRYKELYRIALQIIELNAKKSTTTAEILVTVFVKDPSVSNAKLTLEYIVPNSNWYPTYDVRVKDVTSPIEAQMKAKVRQNSGEDWREVKLTLSTGEPKRTGIKPELGTWFLTEGGASSFVGQKTNEMEEFTKLRTANQFNKIKGKIRDEKGDYLPGVSLVIQGTTRGTTTDFDGNFELDLLPTDKVLTVSFIGFITQNLPISTGSFMDIGLKESESVLSEVVVVGYGTYAGSDNSDTKEKASKKKNPASGQFTIRGQGSNFTTNTLAVKESAKTTTTAFEIDLPYSIPSNNKEYQVDIKEEILAANYQYAVAPKLDNDAFLTATIADWAQYNLIEGDANLYFEGTYLGKTLLKTNSTEDTLKISLGRDKNVVVKRTKLKEFNKNKLFSNKRVETRAYEIVVKNKKSTPFSIVIEEQIPVSTDKQIDVECEAEGATINKILGRLTWKLDIKPSEERKLKFSYSVKHPTDWTINLE